MGSKRIRDYISAEFAQLIKDVGCSKENSNRTMND